MWLIKFTLLLTFSTKSLSFVYSSKKVNRGTPSFFQKKKIDNNNETPKLSHYEEAQTIINQHQGYGVLSTLSIKKKIHGYPSTSIVGFTSDEKGNPIFCLSSIAGHTLNIKKNNIVSFTTTEHFFKNANDYRVSYAGKLKLLNETQEIHQFQQNDPLYHADVWEDIIISPFNKRVDNLSN